MRPLISIIVPVYNAEKYLERCLSSLQNQTYTSIEVILVDDGSKDNSAFICKSFAKADQRFRYFHQENKGVSAARNHGLDLAEGEYIGFCDSDDWVETDMYEFLLRLMDDYQADVSICSFYRDTVSRVDDFKGDNVCYQYESKDAIIEMHRGIKFAGHLCNKLCKRSVIGDMRLDHNIAVMEDMLFMWQVFQNSTRVVYKNTPKYHYMQYAQSTSHSFREAYWSIQNAVYCMLDLMIKYYPEHIDEAKHTVVRGNLQLARRLSEARCLDKHNYHRVMSAINENYSRNAIVYLSRSDRRQLLFLRTHRQLFNAYVYCAMKA